MFDSVRAALVFDGWLRVFVPYFSPENGSLGVADRGLA